ncbi:nicotinate phosphoribosyltransferase [Trinickia caryophylli]|uniref:Nicotinate phosphoribosyltransferase n=1 Tax=Trinickia caryophylli TaxID=28094 RepID=A0A1X7D107_TRICW|nr:nicotinate phosphoribosyltransferase [Trinickia caryophylli]PMS13565.1 nicotinate phosphoribosyltransferase [Trinickia caryophylli]TRX15267.1 nicotinate phosphoribosyltransferase [Trinickia caryophylli]WQE15143.1 nicotinate phosphoribosyltransferase [Trinickia caryophylli]SMF06692.1 nicotinate phosphoribosyltransferase [Trinickia caryophylli]GLU31120.1 nicotinate phosphoribosyltransferase [Trinickia caryophylli]
MNISGGSPLLTDLYELTMLQAYFDAGMNDTATFEFFVRALPRERNFLLAAGLEQVLEYLEGLRLSEDDLTLIAATGRFTPAFVKSLEGLRFTGDVDAMPEGTVFFPDEPILRVTAPIREAQFVESRVINLLHYQTVVASKAARIVLAAPDRLLVDFGLRRAHGAEAAMLSARASYLAGFSGTATLAAGIAFGIPTYGTMAHSFVQACGDEATAFERFARSQPHNATLLIDTYDTESAARKLIALAGRLASEGIAIQAVRIDSGDLAEHARRVRAILDGGGLSHVTIFASGNLDEYRLRELTAADAPIDGFGVGTRMNTSADAPYLDCAYKLVEYAHAPRRKRSEGKATWPGRKSVYRHIAANGVMGGDWLTLEGERRGGEPLIEPAMRGGVRCAALPALEASRKRARTALRALPPAQRTLDIDEPYPVAVSDAIRQLAAQLDTREAERSASRAHGTDHG